GGAMGFFLVLFWCASVAGTVLPYDSRFGVSSSRLDANKFPFGRLRELGSKGLICFAIFGAKTALFENIRENSRFHGNNREFRLNSTAWREARNRAVFAAVLSLFVAHGSAFGDT